MVHLGVVFHDIMVLFRLHFVVLNQVCRSRQQAGQQISVISIHDFSTHNVENQAVKCLNPQLCPHKKSTFQTFQIKKVNDFLTWLFKIHISQYSLFFRSNTLFSLVLVFLVMSHLLKLSCCCEILSAPTPNRSMYWYEVPSIAIAPEKLLPNPPHHLVCHGSST